MPLFSFFLPAMAAATACLPVTGENVTASDLAAAVPALVTLEPGTILFPAPVPGVRRVLTASDLRRLSARFPEASAVTEPATICLERETHTLNESELLQALKEALPLETEIELVESSRYGVPRGRLSFDRRGIPPTTAALAGRPVLWRGTVVGATGRTTPVWVRVRLFHSAEAVVARRDLAPGVVLEASDLVVESRRTPGLASKSANIAELERRTPRRPIRAGEIVTLHATVPAPDVHNGQQVQVEVRQGAVKLTLPARAEGSGRTGSRVWLRALEGGKRFPARVLGPGQAEVEQ